jgi:hypothetical protein
LRSKFLERFYVSNHGTRMGSLKLEKRKEEKDEDI